MTNPYNRTKNAKLNMLSSLLLQIATAISGIILPRLIIPKYGSEINGLIASITQFLSYITLFEAGIGGVFKASLYKPLLQKNMKRVSGIINEQKQFYRKIGIVFIFYVLILSLVYPILIKTKEDNTLVVALIIILSIGTFLEYFISLPYQSLITADQMVRIINISSIIFIILNVVVTSVLISLGTSIIIIKGCTCALATFKPCFYVWYVKKHYALDNKAKPENDALSQRWNGLVHHLSFYIHRNTDILLLSFFVGATSVSVYSIYLAIVTGVQKIITSISMGLSASIGNMIADGNKEIIEKNIKQFELIQIITTTILYTITALMLIPFINIYTTEMRDANYVQPLFGFFLIAAEAVYCIRCIYSTISMNGNKFRETQPGAILESAVNISVSLILIISVNSMELKLMSIAIGTLLGMSVRLVYEIYFLSRGLIYRPMSSAFNIIGIYILTSFASIICCSSFINYECHSVANWIIAGVETSLVVVIIVFATSCLLYKKTMSEIISRLIGRKQK